MAENHRTAVLVLVYLAFVAIALRFFFEGHHVLAFAIVVSVWAILTLWVWFGRRP